MKVKEPVWKENHVIKNIVTGEFQGNIIVYQRQALEIWEDYVI
jgi:hypothetical protein